MEKRRPSFILIIEDDREIREALIELLNAEGYQTWAAKNGAEALDFLQSAPQPPSLILLDLMMPIMNGLEFRKWQLAQAEFCQIPVVVISADQNLGRIHAALQAQRYMGKPFQTAELLAAIKQGIGQ